MPFNPLVLLFTLPFILIGGIMLLLATAICLNNFRLIKRGSLATGTVIRYETSIDSDGGTIYYPVIKFWTKSEKIVEFKHSIGSSSSGYKLNQEVRVIYDPENPKRAKIKSLYLFWLAPILLGLFGLPFFLVGIGILTRMIMI